MLRPTDGLLGAPVGALIAKRVLDLVGAVVTLVVTAPLFLIAAIGVKLTSPGPVLFWSTRVGQRGTHFRIAKFRSMEVDAHEKIDDLIPLNEATGPVFKIRQDPRLTAFGRLIRKFSVDELPQLINVIRGEMSLVGPRPPLPEEVATYDESELQRLAVQPGITCIWQVSGRSDLDFATWMRMDLDYIEQWSLGLDLILLVRTIPAVLSTRGAY